MAKSAKNGTTKSTTARRRVSKPKSATRATGAQAMGAAAESRTAAAIDAEARRRMIEEAAYYIAERHGFSPERDLANWVEAESQINSMLGGSARA